MTTMLIYAGDMGNVSSLPYTMENIERIARRNGFMTVEKVDDSLRQGKAVYTLFGSWTREEVSK